MQSNQPSPFADEQGFTPPDCSPITTPATLTTLTTLTPMATLTTLTRRQAALPTCCHYPLLRRVSESHYRHLQERHGARPLHQCSAGVNLVL